MRRSSPRFRRSSRALPVSARGVDAGELKGVRWAVRRAGSIQTTIGVFFSAAWIPDTCNPDGTPKYTNRLIDETSPYLRQHAHNPVDWYPWGEEAFARALAEGKPIHLSVGYAACHWCHVLAAESFEDEATAHVLNQLYVNIKVDREERPDVDRIYQIAQQMLTQRSGGWPLTMFLTPDDRRPFFGGTYFPKQARFGLPAFGELLLRVARFYREHEAELRQQNEALMSAFAQLDPPPPADCRRAERCAAAPLPPDAGADVRLSLRRLRRGAQISARDLAGAAAAGVAGRCRQRHAGSPCALHVGPDTAAHGRRWYQRSAGRRLLPLFGR